MNNYLEAVRVIFLRLSATGKNRIGVTVTPLVEQGLKESPALFPGTHPSSSIEESARRYAFNAPLQKEAGRSTHLLHQIHPTLVRIS